MFSRVGGSDLCCVGCEFHLGSNPGPVVFFVGWLLRVGLGCDSIYEFDFFDDSFRSGDGSVIFGVYSF